MHIRKRVDNMETKSLIIILLFATMGLSESFAQTGEGISSSGTWVQEDVSMTQVWDPNSNTYVPVGETHYYYCNANGDTIINSIQYRKLYSTEVNYDYSTGLITPIDQTDLLFCFRNEPNKVVYNIYPGQSSESLWYDFNHSEGDYQTFSNIFNTTDLYLYSIDTVQWCDTNLRRHNYTWSASGGLVLMRMIEELGSPDNFVFPYGTDTEYDKVLFFCPSQVAMQDIQLDIISTAKVPELTDDRLIVYPNPHSNAFQVQNLGDNAAVSLYDLQGRLVKNIENPYAEIQTDDLAPGRYILKAVFDGHMSTIPLIRQ